MHQPKPYQFIDIFLQPGDYYFGDEATRLRTLLGSCVAITLWHPQRRIGGMCHYLLPTRGQPRDEDLDPRYGDEAMDLLTREMRAVYTGPEEYQAKLFGGSNMFPSLSGKGTMEIGPRNVALAKHLLEGLGIKVAASHVCGAGHRNLIFDLWNGHVWMKFEPLGEGEKAQESVRQEMQQ